jgi:hypothetical protein
MTHSLCFFVFGFVVVSSISNCFTCKLALLDLANTSFLRMEFRLKREWKHSVGSSGHSACQGIKAECFPDLQQLNFIWLLQRPSFLGWQVKIAERERKKQKTEDLKLQQTLHTCNNRISNTHISRKALYSLRGDNSHLFWGALQYLTIFAIHELHSMSNPEYMYLYMYMWHSAVVFLRGEIFQNTLIVSWNKRVVTKQLSNERYIHTYMLLFPKWIIRKGSLLPSKPIEKVMKGASFKTLQIARDKSEATHRISSR